MNLVIQGRILPEDWSGLEFAPTVNGVGYWKITLASTHPMVPVLTAPGSGIVITTPYDVFSGPTNSPENNRSLDDLGGSVTFNGADDNQVLWDRLAYPDPSTSDTTAQGFDYDTRTDVGESLLHAYTNANVGPGAPTDRANPFLAMGTNLGRGVSVTKAARFDRLGDFLSDLANAQGLTFRVVQRASKLVFETGQVVVRSDSIRLDVDMGTLSGFKVVTNAPTTTHVIVGAQDVTLDRYFATVTSPASLASGAAYGRRIESFENQTYTLDTAAFTQSAVDRLATEGLALTSASVIAVDDTTLAFGRDWFVGDQVGVVVGNTELTSNVTGYVVQSSSDGTRVGAVLGDATKLSPVGAMVAKATALAARVSTLERTGVTQSNRFASRSTSAAQTIPNDSPTTVMFANQGSSDGVTYAASTGVFTVSKTGRYIIDAQVTYTASPGGIRRCTVMRNGAVIRQSINESPGGTGVTVGAISAALCFSYKLSKGDTITFQARQDSGAALALTDQASQNFADIAWVGPAA